MSPTVALLGASGDLGSNLLKPLAAAAKDGKVNLVVLHRATSDTSNVPSEVEKRVLDADNATVEEIQAALKGVDILISATKQSPDGGVRFVENLAKLPRGTIKVYVPSYFTANWDIAEEDNRANVYPHGKCALRDRAIRLGVPVSTVSNGLFESSFLSPFCGMDVKNNRITFYGDALDKHFSFLSLPYLGEAVAQLVTSPHFGPGMRYTVVEQEFTGRQVVDAFEQVNGAKPEIVEMGDEDVEAMRAEGPVQGLAAAWRMHWGNGNWNVVNLFEPVGVQPRTLKEAVQKAK